MKITKVKRIESNDLSGIIRYSAKVDNQLLQYETDGNYHKHLTKKEFIELIKSIEL